MHGKIGDQQVDGALGDARGSFEFIERCGYVEPSLVEHASKSLANLRFVLEDENAEIG
jgi:hypothetical protein